MNADWIIYVVDSGQSTHFELLEKAAAKIGWKTQNHKFNHMSFGVVLNEEGKKFKTRSGESVKLKDLIVESKQRAKQTLLERIKNNEEGEGTGTFLNENELEVASENLGISAIKYFDLKQNRISDYKFSFNNMLD